MDRGIRAAVYEELVTDPLIDADDIVVEVFNGDVSLDGTVPSQASARRRPRRRNGWLARPWCTISWMSHSHPATTGITRPWHSW